MSAAELRASGCAGKDRFDTPQRAWAVVRKSKAKNLQAYRCRFCGLWHIGGKDPK